MTNNCFAIGWIGSVVCLLVVGCTSSPPNATVDVEATRATIRARLSTQVAAWNEGNLDAFMAGYAQTDSLRFASGGTVHRGWEAAHTRYKETYPGRTAMGTLAFDSLRVQVLAPNWAVVFGRWRLIRAEDTPYGVFTLLFERRTDGWRIVHDHTSSAAP